MIIVVLFPIGAVVYYFAVKSKGGVQLPILSLASSSSSPKEIETDETLQLKDLISKFHKAYHYEKLGQTYLETGKFDQALEPFRQAIEREPEMLEARYGLAKSLHGLKRYSEAAEILEDLVKIDKKYDYGNAIFGLAECYRLAGMEEMALATYQTVIQSYHFFKAYYHYAQLLDKKGRKQEAISCMKSIIGTSKNLPEYKLEKEKHWIDEAYKFLRRNGIELA
ncbi:MAG: tetratricopeptide repeat protein [Nitrospinota bacterium]|nr:tetratricopeptide repeat protein [Nitrospinota bacterium]